MATTTESDMSSGGEDVGESPAFCRHCLRPKSELWPQYYNRTNNNNNNDHREPQRAYSKHRHRSRHETRPHLPAATATAPAVTTSRRDCLNAVNAEAIRFRCNQVGPLVGRATYLPPQMHFHHPQHLAYQQQQQHQFLQMHCMQQAIGASHPAPATVTIECESTKGRRQATTRIACSMVQPHDERGEPAMHLPRGHEEGRPAHDTPTALATSSRPDSPSLVKVSTWYTVAKQGVSC